MTVATEDGSDEEDEEDDIVIVDRTSSTQDIHGGELQQLPLGMALAMEVHSGKEHPQWPGGRLVIDAKDCRNPDAENPNLGG